ncbi:hypothetical protein [Nocardiopsis kunsanensis]|uniref:hypothetical protein n=1 Tax=Nocardiopsis kunsanensis TaxID=141693 RepID=UPI0003716383|nr:hypothetical protein [Nocardiopsis kunsanensis]
MSLYPIIWAAEHAPVRDAEERSILMALVIKADFDGCNAFRSYKRLATVAKCDPKTAERRCKAMEERGLIRRQPGPKPRAWKHLPADKKTVVWEAMIPASFWSAVQLAEINEAREERGRAPVTPKTRPDLPEAPPKKARADKGKARPNRRKKKPEQKEPGDYKSPGSEEHTAESGGTTSPVAGGLQVQSRGDYKSTNPPNAPSDSPSSPPAPPAGGGHDRPETDPQGGEDELSPTTEEEHSEQDARLERAQKLIDHAVRLWPKGHRPPSARDRVRLTERVVAELAADGDDTSIVFELSRDLRDAGSAVSVIMGSRTTVPGWGRIHDPRPDHSRHEIQTARPWCGQCTERTRLTNYYNPQTGESRPGRCRAPVVDHTGQTVACHPYATPRREADEASNAPEEMSTEELQAAMEESFEKATATARSGAARAREALAREQVTQS